MAEEDTGRIICDEMEFYKFASTVNSNPRDNMVGATIENTEASKTQGVGASNDANLNTMLNTMNMLMQQNATMLQMITSQNDTSKNFSIMPDLSKSINDFNGENGVLKAKHWIEQIENTAMLHSWPESFTFETARIHLKGAAYHWFRGKGNEILTWVDFKNAFKKTFLHEKSLTYSWKEMQSRVQAQKENISSYFHEKVRLCKELNLSFAEIKEQTAIGLWSRELSTLIMAKHHYDEDEMYKDILAYERVNAARSDRIEKNKPVTHKHTEINKTELNGTVKREVNETRTGRVPRTLPIKNEKGEWKCFNCNKYGHIAKDCTEPKREVICRNCGIAGHIQRYCKGSKGSVNTIEQFKQSDDVKPTVAKYIKMVKLNGKPFSCLVDPGSSECTIKATAVITGNFKVDNDTATLKGFGNSNYVTSCGTVTVQINLDGVVANNSKLRIVPDDVQPKDVIIGRTFTDLPHVVYFKLDDKLHFQYRNKMNLPTEIDLPHTTVSISTDEIIEPETMLFINTEVNHEHFCMPVANFSSQERQVERGEIFKERIVLISDKLSAVEPIKEPVTIKEMNVDNDTTNEQKEELLTLLNEFRDCIAKNIYEIGKTDLVEMKIEELDDSKPIASKPYKVNNKDRCKIRDIVGEWKSAGIVRETTSPYASPVLLVTKKTGESRLVVDYRKLNTQTKRVNFPLPNLDDHIQLLRESKLFVILDLAHGYLQMPISRDSQAKTAFITPEETGEFTRSMFGLMNAPFYFSKLMQTVLEPFRDKFVLFFLDDILIPAKDWPSLMFRLRKVLERLKEANLTIKLAKCEFGRKRIQYLGYVISAAGIEPGTRKLDAIKYFPRPTDAHGIRRYMGLASFFRRFIQNFAALAEPLTRLTRKNHPFEWKEEQDRAFNEIKHRLLTQPVLKVYNPDAKRSELHTDASSNGIGALFMQADENDQLHPVYAVSRRTSDTEKHYHSSKLELLAIVWAIERLKIFLINIKFVVLTDCQALTFLNKNKTKNAQVIRWCNLLSDYDFEIKFKSGQIMKHADALSRAPVDPPESDLDTIMLDKFSILSIVTREEEIMLVQYSDKFLQRKMDILKKNKSDISVSERNEIKDYKFKNGLLYKVVEGDEAVKDLYVIPKCMRKTIAIKYHDLCGHIGLDKCIKKISEFYYFPAMRNYLKRHISMCIECILSKNVTGRQPGFLHPIPPGDRPFAIIHVDHMGPLVTTKKCNKYVLAIIDNLTKFVQLEAVKNTKTDTTITRIERFIERFGSPGRIISDRGTSFTSRNFEEMCSHHGIRHTLNSSRHPQANGLVERLNATLLPMMRSAVEDAEGKDWDTHIKKIERDINTSINKTTNKTPFELLYGYIPRFGDGNVRELTLERETYKLPEELRDEVKRTIEQEQQKYKHRYDRHRYAGLRYNIGDVVFAKAPRQATGESTKLQSRYKGPLVISKILPGDTYQVMDLREDNKKTYISTAHVSQLKLWKLWREDESEDEWSDNEEPKDTQKEKDEDTVVIVARDESEDKGKEQERREQGTGRIRRKPKYLREYHLEDEITRRMTEC